MSLSIHPVALRVRQAVTLAVVVVGVGALGACGVGKDAVSSGDTFEFVSPGGKTEITYDPPTSRKRVADLGGENVVDGAPLKVSDFDGKVVVVNVWGQWCGPCRAEVDDLEQAYEQTRASGVEFVGINFRDSRQAAQDYIRNNDVTYPSIYDYPGRTLVRLTTPTSVVPTTVVLDREHRAAAVFLRVITAAELTPLIRRLAAEPYTPVREGAS